MITRSLQDIYAEITTHKEEIKKLEQEIKDFQSACPHPEAFQKVERKSYDDEYGTIEGYSIKTSCLLCGHTDYKEESVSRTRYR